MSAPTRPTTVSVPGSPRPVTPMSILAKRLDEIVDQLADDADPLLRSELQEVLELAGGLDPYLDRFTTPESAALGQLARLTESEDWRDHAGRGAAGPLEQEMLSGHVEGQLLKMLVRMARAERILEIGMFTGYSALAMAESLPPGGRLIACEIDPEVAAFAQRCFRDSASGEKIDVRVGPATTTLADLAADGEVFDLVFIDADKAGYAEYLSILLDGDLLASHGVICVDNTLMQGQPWVSRGSTANGIAIATFNEMVAADPRVEQVIVPLRDGLTLIHRVRKG